MRRATVLSLTAAAGLLAGCASGPAPAPVAGMGWSLTHVEGEGAKFAYGQPQSDDVLVMLTCEPGSNEIRISTLTDRPKGRQGLTLSSGGQARRYPAQAGPAGFGDGVVLESLARPTDPVLASFAASGRLAIEAGGRRTAIPAADPRQARAFISSCER